MEATTIFIAGQVLWEMFLLLGGCYATANLIAIILMLGADEKHLNNEDDYFALQVVRYLRGLRTK